MLAYVICFQSLLSVVHASMIICTVDHVRSWLLAHDDILVFLHLINTVIPG